MEQSLSESKSSSWSKAIEASSLSIRRGTWTQRQANLNLSSIECSLVPIKIWVLSSLIAQSFTNESQFY